MRSRYRTIVFASAAVVALAGLQLARQPGTKSWQSMWAEDGAVYGSDVLRLPLWQTGLRGYGGYVQLVPRVLAMIAPAVPITRVAALFALEAVLVTALLAVFVYRCTGGWIEHRGLRTVVAGMTALVPAAQFETSANIANLGWPLLIASGWACVSRRAQVVDAVVRVAVVVAAALTTTLAVVLWPISLAIALRTRERRDRTVVLAFSIALGLQFALDRFAYGSGRSTATSSAGDLVQVFGVRVLGSAMWGERWLPDLWSKGHYLLVLTAALVLAGVVFACRRAPTERWWFAGVSLALAFAMFSVPVWTRGSSPMRMHSTYLNVVGSRYLVVPIVVLASGLAVLVDGSGRRWLRNLIVVHSFVLIIVSFQLANARSDSTPWFTEVRAARAACVDKPNTAVVDLHIAPNPWTIGISCDRLR